MADDFEFVDDDDFEFVDDADFDWEGIDFVAKGSKSEHLSEKVSLSGLMRIKIPGSKT